jgi:NAD(P)-dependent dehydrogenase (short-subunit alcohol dehydrogenase family)
MASEYSKKSALVTGGARGSGRAIALALAGRGYRVAIVDLDAAAARKLPLQFLRCDVASPHAAPHLRARHRGLRRLEGRPGGAQPRARDEPRPARARELREPGLDRACESEEEGPRPAPRRALSDAAGFVTGQNFVIDGGMTRKMIYVD